MHSAIREDNISITCKAIRYDRKPLVSLYITGALEKFIEHSNDSIL